MKSGFFPDKDFSTKLYSHNLEELVRLANLESKRKERSAKQPKFEARWATVKAWGPASRYDGTIDRAQAEQLIEAVQAPRLGVMTWLKKYW
jgi:hypothetical protein